MSTQIIGTKASEIFRQKLVHQIMLQTLHYPNTTRNVSNIMLKTYRSLVTQW